MPIDSIYQYFFSPVLIVMYFRDILLLFTQKGNLSCVYAYRIRNLVCLLFTFSKVWLHSLHKVHCSYIPILPRNKLFIICEKAFMCILHVGDWSKYTHAKTLKNNLLENYDISKVCWSCIWKKEKVIPLMFYN